MLKKAILTGLAVYLYCPLLYAQNDTSGTMRLLPKEIETVLQTGHSDAIECLAYSINGKYIATGGNDGNIIIWDTKTGIQLKLMKGHEESVNAICFSLDGKQIYSAGEDQKIFIWDIDKNEVIQKFEDHLWSVNALDISSDGLLMASGSGDETIILWDLKGNQFIDAFKGHNADVRDIDFNFDNSCLASCSGSFQKKDNSVRIWDVKSRRQLKKYMGSSPMLSIDFHPNQHYIASCDDDGYVYVWDLKSDKLVKKFLGHDNRIMEIEFDKTGDLLLSGSVDGSVKIWDWKKGNTIDSVTYPNTNVLISRFSPNNKQVAIGGTDHSLRLWNLLSDRKEKQLKYNNIQINSIDVSRNGNILISGDFHGYVRIWDIKNMTLVQNFKAHSDYISKVSFASGDSTFLTVSHDGAIKVWSLRDTIARSILEGHSQVVCNAKFNPTGDKIVSTSFEEIIIWNLKNNEQLKKWKIKSGWIYGLCFSYDGAYIASGSWEDGIIIIWDSQTGNYVKSFTAQSGGITALDFNPQGNLLVAGGGGNNVFWVWDVEKSIPVFTCHAHNSDVQDVRFDSHGHKIVSASADHTIKIWDVFSYKNTATFRGHKEIVQSASFIPETEHIVSAGGDGQIIIWDTVSKCSIVSIFYGTGRDYIITTTNKYYTGSKKGVERMAFVKEGIGYFFEQFDLKYNRPDLVLGKLPNSDNNLICIYHRAYKKRLQKMNFTENMLSDDFHVPEISVTNTPLPDMVTDKIIRFNIRATDTQHPLDRLNVFVNDVPIYGIKGIDLRPKNTQQHEQTLEIELAPGENKIQVSVLNQAGAESLKETFYVTYTAPARKPDLYLIGIGSGQFQNTAMNLDFPAKDVRDFAKFLQENKSHYANVYVDTLLNRDLTRSKLATIKNKLLRTKVDDHVILYVAGHGILDDSLDYYFPTHDTDFRAPKSKAIPYEALEDLLDAIPARQKLLLMDACHAGELDKENVTLAKEQQTIHGTIKFRAVGPNVAHKKIGLENSFELMKELFVDLRRGTGATVIAGAGGVQAALEGGQWNNSVFMYTLLSGLRDKKADSNKDGAITVSELQTFLGAEVERLTNGAQRPTSRLENIANDWRIW